MLEIDEFSKKLMQAKLIPEVEQILERTIATRLRWLSNDMIAPITETYSSNLNDVKKLTEQLVLLRQLKEKFSATKFLIAECAISGDELVAVLREITEKIDILK